MIHPSVQSQRRLLVKFLLGSPLLGLSACSSPEEKKVAVEKALDGILSPADALNVFDFEKVAKQKIPTSHWGYLSTGVNDDRTIQANRDAFDRVKLRMRRLIDPTKVDMTTEIFGRKYPTPIIIDPVGSQRAFHEDGELATARAAKAKNHLQILSTVTTYSIEDVTKERGAPVWYQLYALNDWEATKDMIRRAEEAGSEVLVFTVDLAAGSTTCVAGPHPLTIARLTVDTPPAPRCLPAQGPPGPPSAAGTRRD